jgi:hypothetical protein
VLRAVSVLTVLAALLAPLAPAPLAPLALLAPLAPHPAPEGSAVAVISHRFWLREFGGQVEALGRLLRIDAVPFTIVGITPPAFDDLVVGRPADFFIPMASEPLLRRNSSFAAPRPAGSA